MLLLLSSCSASGQDINDQLRGFFSLIKPAPNPAPFFYDMAVHEIEDKWFTPVNMKDTAEPHVWWTIYYEMRNAAYDKEIMPETFLLQSRAKKIISKDTIPIGILDLEFNRLKETAFDSGVYFGWTDSFLFDVATVKGHPYLANTIDAFRHTKHDIFCATPLSQQSEFRNVTFSIDPGFIFYSEPYNSFTKYPPDHIIKINFGDGYGWRRIDVRKRTYINVDYPATGIYKIEVKVENDAIIRYSQSTIYVLSNKISTQPDLIIDEISGIKAGVYYGCTNQNYLNKVLIAVSGFDLFETQTIPKIYDQLINEPQLIMLRNYGYDIVCVDWDDSKDALENNGDRLIALLEYLKCNVLTVEHNFTVIGISMGALISNYALTKMETDDYLAGARADHRLCYPDQMHNTRTFISLEGEYQGAFINIGAQRFAEILKHERAVNRIPSFTINSLSVDAAFLRDEVLDRKGVKQMLKFHVDSTDGKGNFFPHTERVRFLDYMASIGSKPKYVKKIALSSSLANGMNQVALGNKLAKPGDAYYHVNLNFKLRIFGGLRLPIDFHTRLNSHPDSGCADKPVLSYGLSYPRKLNLKGCLRKLISAGNCSRCKCVLNYSNEHELFLAPGLSWDVMCGGRVSTATAVFSENDHEVQTTCSFSKLHPFGYLSYALVADSKSGNAHAKATYRIGGIIRSAQWRDLPVTVPLLDANIDVHAELESFNFVPWTSAYDYQRPDSLNQDILNTPVDTNLARIPFDMMIGRAPHADFPITFPAMNDGQKHFEHRDIRRDNVEDHPDLTILTREIGDRKMYLDNMFLNRRSLFEAEREIGVGSGANLRYHTPGRLSRNAYPAVWAREDGFKVVAGGEVHLKAGEQITLHPGFTVTEGGEFKGEIQKIYVCNFSLEELRAMDAQKKDTVSEVERLTVDLGIRVYPNPADRFLIIEADNEGEYKFYSLTGNLIYHGTFSTGSTVVKLKSLMDGMYFIQLHCNGMMSTVKIIKENDQ